MNRRKRKRMLVWSAIVGGTVVVLAVLAVREMLLASSFLCTTSHVINNYISALVCPFTGSTVYLLISLGQNSLFRIVPFVLLLPLL